jgi:hypothetical protein
MTAFGGISPLDQNDRLTLKGHRGFGNYTAGPNNFQGYTPRTIRVVGGSNRIGIVT